MKQQEVTASVEKDGFREQIMLQTFNWRLSRWMAWQKYNAELKQYFGGKCKVIEKLQWWTSIVFWPKSVAQNKYDDHRIRNRHFLAAQWNVAKLTKNSSDEVSTVGGDVYIFCCCNLPWQVDFCSGNDEHTIQISIFTLENLFLNTCTDVKRVILFLKTIVLRGK